MLKQHQVRQQNTPDGEIETAQSHLEDSKPHQVFLPPLAVRVPAVSRLLVTEDASSEKRGQDASGDQLFHPPPQTQVTLTKAKVDPAGLR